MNKGLIALALGTFGLGITEFSTMAILPYIASDIGIAVPKAGTFVSAYLVGVGTGAVLLAFAGRVGLKKILLTLMTLVALGNLCSSLASDYLPLLLCRIIAGLPHGAFYGTSAVVAERLATEGKGNRAVAVVMTGMMVANLVGVPLATALGAMVSWRLVFVLVGCWALLVLTAIWRLVPNVENPQSSSSLITQLSGLRSIKVWLLLMVILCGNAAVFGWYSYITPLFTTVAGFSTFQLPYLMVLAGLGMVVGNLLSGRMSDRFGSSRIVSAAQGTICLVLVLIFFLSDTPLLCVLLMVLGIGSFAALTSPEQVLFLRLLRGRELLAMTMAQIGFTVGGTLGTSIIGVALGSGMDYHYPALIGSAFALTGCLISLYFSRSKRLS